MKSKIKISGILIIPTLIATIANIVIGKVIALYISPDEFGIYSLEFIVFSLLNAIFIVPIINAFKTYKKDLGTDNGLKYFDNLFYLFFIFSIIGLIFLGGFGFRNISHYSAIIICIYILFQALFNLRMAVLNLNSDFLNLAKFNILSSVLQVIVLILIVVILGYKNHFSLWSSSVLFSCITLGTVFFYLHPSQLSLVKYFKNHSNLNKTVFLFCFPLILVAFLTTINNYADRYIIEYFLNTFEVGIYSAGYGLGSKISLLMAPILLYLSPFVYNNIFVDKYKIFIAINKVLFFHFVLGLLCFLLLYFFKNNIGILFLSKEYEDSFVIIPLIAFAFIMFNSIFAVETYFFAAAKTKMILIHNIIGATSNLILNFYLIPPFGIKGAAYASIISFTIQFFTAYSLMIFSMKNKI